MKRALVLINPKSRSGAFERPAVIRSLGGSGFEIVEPPDPKPNHFSSQIEEHKDKVDLVVVGGGDGSIRGSVEGLLKTGLPLGILPLGTANNLARNLKLPLDPFGAIDVIRSGKTKKIDVASVNGAYFLNASGIGLSTRINRNIGGQLKKRWGIFSYVILAMRLVERLPSFRAEIEFENQVREIKSTQITISNGRHYGAGLQISTDATLTDGTLELVSTRIKSLKEGLFLLPRMKKGEYPSKSGVLNLKSEEFKIRTEIPLQIDADGEIVAGTPAQYKVHRKVLSVFVP